MLYNKLIYTGVTRAKKSLMIVGDPNCFLKGIQNDFVDYRKTTLKEFILKKYNYLEKQYKISFYFHTNNGYMNDYVSIIDSKGVDQG